MDIQRNLVGKELINTFS